MTLDPHYYAPDGTPWCRFKGGSLECINGSRCKNPYHINIISIEGQLNRIIRDLQEYNDEQDLDQTTILTTVEELTDIITVLERSHADTPH